MLGKLKKTIKEKCPLCGNRLQIRTMSIPSLEKGIDVSFEEEYICCSNKNCDYTRDVIKKKSHRKKLDNPPSFD